jgi:Xylose isomerase-like TIM barrel.
LSDYFVDLGKSSGFTEIIKDITMIQNRRKFISTIVAGGVTIPLISNLHSLIPESDKNVSNIRLFSKPLDNYDFDFMCECTARSGIGGLDLTVRPGGKVEPADVETSLPKLIERAGKYKLTIDMIVTGIVSASDPLTERVLKTASHSGIKFYRLGWFDYDFKKGVWETLQQYRSDLVEISKINRKYKIHGGYQNHAGTYVGAPVWDLHELFRDIPPEIIGSQYDVRHAMVEGTDSWTVGMRLIAKHIKTLALKDFIWKTDGAKPQPVTVPMGEGMIDWDLYFKLVKELNINAPITLHVEYPLLEKEDLKLSLSQQQEIIVRKLKKDTDFINSYLKKYQLPPM